MLHKLQSIQGLVPLVGELENPMKSYSSNFTGLSRNQVTNWWSEVAEKANCISAPHWSGFDRYSVDESRYLVTTSSGLLYKDAASHKSYPISLGASVSVRSLSKKVVVRVNMGYPMDVEYFAQDAAALHDLTAQYLSRWITHRLLANLGKSLGTDKTFDIKFCLCAQTLDQAQDLLNAFKANKGFSRFADTSIGFVASTNEELLDLFQKTNSSQTQILANLKQAYRSRIIKNVAKASLEDQSFPVLWEALDDWACSSVNKRDSGVGDRENIAMPLRDAFAKELQEQDILVLDRYLGQAMGSRFITKEEAQMLLAAVHYDTPNQAVSL